MINVDLMMDLCGIPAHENVMNHVILVNTLIMWFVGVDKGSISVFQEIFPSTDKIVISRGLLSTRQLFYEVLRFS